MSSKSPQNDAEALQEIFFWAGQGKFSGLTVGHWLAFARNVNLETLELKIAESQYRPRTQSFLYAAYFYLCYKDANGFGLTAQEAAAEAAKRVPAYKANTAHPQFMAASKMGQAARELGLLKYSLRSKRKATLRKSKHGLSQRVIEKIVYKVGYCGLEGAAAANAVLFVSQELDARPLRLAPEIFTSTYRPSGKEIAVISHAYSKGYLRFLRKKHRSKEGIIQMNSAEAETIIAKVQNAAREFKLNELSGDDWKSFASAVTFDDLAQQIKDGAWLLSTEQTGFKPAVAQHLTYRALLGAVLFLQAADKPDAERPTFAAMAKHINSAIGDNVNSGRLQTILKSYGIKKLAAPAPRVARQPVSSRAPRVAKVRPTQLTVLNETLTTGAQRGGLKAGQTPAQYAICRIHALAFAGYAASEIEKAIAAELGDDNPLHPGTLAGKTKKNTAPNSTTPTPTRSDDGLYRLAFELGSTAYKASKNG